MIDRNKVMKSIECCLRTGNTNLCGECSYKNVVYDCKHALIKDVHELLKEQDSLIEIARSQGWSDGWCKGYDECEKNYQEYM